MNMQCHCCGKRFRSMSAEAKHRHNFPAYCNKSSRRWKEFQAELAAEDRRKALKSEQAPVEKHDG